MARFDELTNTPGLALQSLWQLCTPASLRTIIDQSALDVLRQLDPELLDSAELSQVASKLFEPANLLGDADMRVKVVGLLPLPKARELARRIGADAGRSVYAHLGEAVRDQGCIAELYSFFGVVEDPRAPSYGPPSVLKVTPEYGLFEHQRVAAQKVLRRLSEEPRKVVLHMPTGSGKTRTAMHIVASHLRSRESTLVVWLAHSQELLEQAASEFESSWSRIGNREIDLVRFWGNRQADILAIQDGVIVAGLGKLHSLDRRDPNAILRLADRASLTIIDEAHQALAPTYESLLSTLYTKRPNNALLGLTATPGRTWADVVEDQKLSDMFERQKVTLEVEGYPDPVNFLIQEGFLANPTFVTLNSEAGLNMSDDDISTLSRAVDVPQSILERLGDDSRRNLKILTTIEDLTKRHSRVVVFAPSVKSSKLLAALLTIRGHEADAVTANSGALERERLIRRFRSADPNPMVLCNYGVLTTGFDAPRISAAVIARPTRSLVLYSQMVGRATRGPRVGGNERAEVVTVVDPHLPGFGSIVDAFKNWEDVWNDPSSAD